MKITSREDAIYGHIWQVVKNTAYTIELYFESPSLADCMAWIQAREAGYL